MTGDAAVRLGGVAPNFRRVTFNNKMCVETPSQHAHYVEQPLPRNVVDEARTIHGLQECRESCINSIMHRHGWLVPADWDFAMSQKLAGGRGNGSCIQ